MRFIAALFLVSTAASASITLNCVEFSVDADPRFEVSLEQAARHLDLAEAISFAVPQTSVPVAGCNSRLVELDLSGGPTPMNLVPTANPEICVYESAAIPATYGWVCARD